MAGDGTPTPKPSVTRDRTRKEVSGHSATCEVATHPMRIW
jgi:hypothetical protein